MIKFAVYSKVKFIEKPDWLNIFGKKYVKDGWHVTLKQSCYINSGEISDIKNIILELNKGLNVKNSKIIIDFDKIVFDKEKIDGGRTIMIRSTKNKDILKLQKRIVNALKKYTEYCNSESRGWEKYFKPHITIASNLDEKEFLKVKSVIKKGYKIIGIIDSITFVHVKEDGKKIREDFQFR